MKYNKPFLSFQDQVNLLKSRNLLIADNKKFENFLSNVNYYKFSGYLKFFETSLNNYNNTPVETVIDLYYLDRDLRNFLMKAIEKIEISFKTQIAYTLAKNYGPFGHTDQNNFFNSYTHSVFLNKLTKEEGKSKEKYILHYKNKYTSEKYTPIWISIELLPFGNISKLYENMKNQDKQIIAKHYNASKEDFESWLKNLTLLRNFCAHNSVIWNRLFNSLSQKKEWHNFPYKWRKISGMIFLIKYLTNIINPNFKFNELETIIRKHIKKHPSHLKHMGFNSNQEIFKLLK